MLLSLPINDPDLLEATAAAIRQIQKSGNTFTFDFLKRMKNLRNLNWRKFTIRLTWVLSVIIAIIYAIAGYIVVTESFHPSHRYLFDYIIHPIFVGACGFAGTWGAMFICWLITKTIIRIVKWLSEGLIGK